MASNYTENYGLCQWEATDQVLRTEFNEDNAKIDQELGELAKTAAEHSDTLATRGNCQIYSASYTGNGTLSHSHTFPGQPLAVFISGPYFQLIALRGNSDAFTMEEGNYWGAVLTWNDRTLTVSYHGTLGGGDSKIGNETGSVYYLVALIDAEE